MKGWLYVLLTAALLYWLIRLYSKQRTQSELALRENEKKYRELFEAANDGIFLSDESGFTDCNQKGAVMYGLRKDEIIGHHPSEFAPKRQPDGRTSSEFAQEKIKAALSGVPQVFEWQPVRADGSPFEVEITLSRLELDHKTCLQAIVRDISERKRTERQLKESEERYRSLSEANFEGIALSDNGILIDANPQLARMLGYEFHEIIGRSIMEFIVPDDREMVKRNIDIGVEQPYENRLLRKDGSASVVETRAKHFVYKGKNVRVTVLHDITERKQAEMELEKYRNQLENLVEQRTTELSLLNDQLRQSQKLEAVGILAGGVAHEFSNILATMKGSIYLIQKKLPQDSPAVKYADQILASINKANMLSQDLLTFSRKQRISLRPLHFNEIIGNVGKMLITLIGEDIELEVRLSEKNPTVMADANQIEQVLLNLATNARDAMPGGGVLTISSDVFRMDEDFKRQHGYGVPGKYAVLCVSDDGAGIEEEIRGKIFEPFFTTKAVGKGSGLGLAVTYGIVKQHNGFIDVESVAGKGTCFKVYLPIAEAEVTQPTSQDSRLPVGGTETILLAEDDDDARSTMSEMVRMTGYTVLEAKDGEEAIRIFIENKDMVRLIFLDVRMPKKNGRAVYEEIRKMSPLIKFLFISGYNEDAIDPVVINAEGINFISKAASPDEILRKIREVLDR